MCGSRVSRGVNGYVIFSGLSDHLDRVFECDLACFDKSGMVRRKIEYKDDSETCVEKDLFVLKDLLVDRYHESIVSFLNEILQSNWT